MRRPTGRVLPLAVATATALLACTQESSDDGLGFGSAGPGPASASASASASAGDAGDEASSSETSAPEGTTGDDAAAEGSEASGNGEVTETTSPESGPQSSDASDGDGDGDSSSAGEPLEPFAYGRCSDGCDADHCTTIDGFNGSFCTTECVDGVCPQPVDGDAVAQCLLGPDLAMPPVNCVLTCSVAAQDCPVAMACVDAMMGSDAGICLWL